MKRVFTKLASAALAAVMTMSCVPATDISFIAPRIVQAAVSTVNITEAKGWLETAWVEWTPTSTDGVSYYTVSYSKDGSTYTTIDDELVRSYKDGHWRADLVGLAKGTYTVKVSAMNSSDAEVASETGSVTVEAHDRTGFTFSSASTCYDSSDPLQCGAYKGDGTLKANAEVLYITSASDIDSITDANGTQGLGEILKSRDKVTTNPLVVRFIGKIDYSGSQLNNGYIQIKPSAEYTKYNVTVEGIGEDASVNFGFLVRNAGNVEIRNFAIHDFADDGVSLDTANCNVWIHNNEFFYGVQGSGDKAKGDGSSDVKNDSQFVTLSYNHYWDAGKCSLCGMKSETGDNFITYHHNWFDHSDSRHPRIRTMFVHVYNNYFDGNAKYGVGASEGSSAFLEGNYFRNCKYPTLQGSVGCDSDGAGGSSTLDDTNPIGAIKMWNNYIEGANSKYTLGSNGETSSNADAVVATSRNQTMTYTTAAGATYGNQDVSNAYIQSLANVVEEPAAAKATVEKYAGRVGGGNFAEATGFAFTTADDTDYDINTTLRTALTNYTSDSSISNAYVINTIGGSVDGTTVPDTGTGDSGTTGGGSTDTGSGDTGSGDTGSGDSGTVVTGGYVHNFTTSGATSDFYTITGSLSTGKGTVTYGDLTLTQCLKMESSTNISFTAPSAGKLTLVFGGTTSASGKTVKVDNNSQTIDSTQILTVDVAAGAHTVTKGDAINLFYMAYVPDSDTGSGDTGSGDTGSGDTGSGDTGSGDTGSGDNTGSDTGSGDTGSGDTGSTTELTALDAGEYAAATMISDTTRFTVTGNNAGTNATTQVKIDENGSVKFKVNDNANVTIEYKCGSSDTAKSASISCAGQTGTTLVGGATSTTLALTGLGAGEYTITATQTGGTTAQIVKMNVSYGSTTTDPEPTVVKGDANGDGTVDKNDVTYILAYAVGKNTTVDSSADVNGDNVVTVADAYLISKYVLGITTTL